MKYSAPYAKSMAFGVPFDTTSRDTVLVDELLAGKLTLPPHPTWNIPDELTWYENPFGEVNWQAQINMLRWLDPLRRAADQGNKQAADLWIRVVSSWIEKNPPGKGRSTYTWSDMVEAVRAMTMCFGLPMLEIHAPEAIDQVLKSIAEHGEWLANPKNIRRGNHALQQHQGLLVIGSVLERQDWLELATSRAVELLKSDYDHQGINAEGAPQYHQINFNWWNLVRRRLEIVGGAVPPEFERILRAPIGLAHATRPDGNYELIGDTEIFALRGIDHPAVRFVQTKGEQGTPPLETTKVLDAGYVFGRTTWGTDTDSYSNADFFSIRFGPQNRIHGHHDGMALTLFSKGESMLIDSGKYAYDAKDPLRSYVQSRRAHNSVDIPDHDYDLSTSVELTRHIKERDFEYFEFQDPGYSGIKLVRQIIVALHARKIFVRDRVASGTPATPRQNWHLSPDAGHRKADASNIFVKGKSSSLWLSQLTEPTNAHVVSGHKHPYVGWHSPTWRKAIPVRTVSINVPLTTTGLVTMIDFSENTSAPILINKTVEGASEFAATVASSGKSFHVGFGPNWAGLSFNETSNTEDFVRTARDEFAH